MAVENETPEDETPEGGEGAAETSLLDSINEALAPTLPETPVVDDEGADDEDELEGEDDETNEDGTPRERDPATGKFLPKTNAPAKAGEGAAGAGKDAGKLGPDGKPLPVADKKAADPVNDPIPDEVKGRTRERMQSLIATVKEKDEHIAIQNQLVDAISATGATEAEFGAMLGYMKWIHSDKPEDLRQARDLLMAELEGLSLKLGEAAPGIDFLAKFPDLQEKVNNGQITTEDAKEIALHRQRTSVETTRRTMQQTQEQTAAAATAARNAGIAELNELGKTLNETDPDFATKHEILKPILSSLGQLPPAKWKAAFTSAYKAITPQQVARFQATGNAAPAAGAKLGQKPAGNQPLRGNKVPTGGQDRQATSLLDAVNAAIDAAG